MRDVPFARHKTTALILRIGAPKSCLTITSLLFDLTTILETFPTILQTHLISPQPKSIYTGKGQENTSLPSGGIEFVATGRWPTLWS